MCGRFVLSQCNAKYFMGVYICYGRTECVNVEKGATIRIVQTATTIQHKTQLHTQGWAKKADPEILPLHLKEMFQEAPGSITRAQKRQAAALLSEYRGVILGSDERLECTDKVEHTIPAGDAWLINNQPSISPWPDEK